MIAINLLLSVMCAENAVNDNPLTPEEERIIVHGGTEYPFTGEYYAHFESGTYHCKRCNAPLYRSDAKFESGCGWPSFDTEIPNAVKRLPDTDGIRTEIRCASCDAHLGHVFLDEGLTPRNTRHCVNSLSLTFLSETTDDKDDSAAKAYFAGGCFWGVEHFFQAADGVLKTRVGYMGGTTEHPTYTEVCGGETGHAEAVEVVYDPSRTDFETLARMFFEIHDPTQVNRQGPDIGEQYRSVVFYNNNRQKETALRLIDELRKNGYDVVTEVVKADAFWVAEDYHQQYYEKKNGRPYCHVYRRRFE